MSLSGNIYGVVLNDIAERAKLAADFAAPPYNAPPVAPVVYMKPFFALAKGPVRIRAGSRVTGAATLALLFARDASYCDPAAAWNCVGAAALTLDFAYPRANYYRPAIAQQNSDGFLAIGEWKAPELPPSITTAIDGRHAHDWTIDRLALAPAALVAELSHFMTLLAGDILLVGLPGDAPLVGAGQSLTVSATGFAPLSVMIEESKT